MLKTKLFSLSLVGLSVLNLNAQAQARTPLTVTARQEHMIQEITSVFENSVADFRYNYIEDISDGAGITAGRVGFNSGCGSLNELIQAYVAAKPEGTPLAKYIQPTAKYPQGCLASLKGTRDYACLYPSLSAQTMAKPEFRLEGNKVSKVDFGKDFMDASADPVFSKVQDELVDREIFQPALKYAEIYGIKTALGISVIYDTILQQGPGLLGFIVPRTNHKFSSVTPGRTTPGTGVNEAAWLKEFLRWRLLTQKYGPDMNRIRHQIKNDYDSTERSVALAHVLSTGNLNFTSDVKFHCYEEDFDIKD